MIDAESFNRARFDLVKALAVLTLEPACENTLAARNLMYHADELCRWLDAFYAASAEPDSSSSSA